MNIHQNARLTPQGRAEVVRQLPEVADWLERGYDLAVHGDGYRIYAKRRGP